MIRAKRKKKTVMHICESEFTLLIMSHRGQRLAHARDHGEVNVGYSVHVVIPRYAGYTLPSGEREPRIIGSTDNWTRMMAPVLQPIAE